MCWHVIFGRSWLRQSLPSLSLPSPPSIRRAECESILMHHANVILYLDVTFHSSELCEALGLPWGFAYLSDACLGAGIAHVREGLQHAKGKVQHKTQVRAREARRLQPTCFPIVSGFLCHPGCDTFMILTVTRLLLSCYFLLVPPSTFTLTSRAFVVHVWVPQTDGSCSRTPHRLSGNLDYH